MGTTKGAWTGTTQLEPGGGKPNDGEPGQPSVRVRGAEAGKPQHGHDKRRGGRQQR